MNEILEKVKVFAARAHGDQQRKYAPEPYIEHPVRVMQTCREYVQELPVLAAALLHDVLEDTAVSKDEMEAFLVSILNEKDAGRTLDLVVQLTDIYTKKAWPKMNRRSRKNREADRLSKVSAEAQTIKYADIIDNAKAISGDDPAFAQVYLRECAQLLQVMDKGQVELRSRAMEEVEEELKIVKNI